MYNKTEWQNCKIFKNKVQSHDHFKKNNVRDIYMAKLLLSWSSKVIELFLKQYKICACH